MDNTYGLVVSSVAVLSSIEIEVTIRSAMIRPFFKPFDRPVTFDESSWSFLEDFTLTSSRELSTEVEGLLLRPDATVAAGLACSTTLLVSSSTGTPVGLGLLKEEAVVASRSFSSMFNSGFTNLLARSSFIRDLSANRAADDFFT